MLILMHFEKFIVLRGIKKKKKIKIVVDWKQGVVFLCITHAVCRDSALEKPVKTIEITFPYMKSGHIST